MKKTINVKKQILSIFLLIILSISCLTSISGCFFDSNSSNSGDPVYNGGDLVQKGTDGITYQADTRFLYSMNGGVNWSETIQEIQVNQTYYFAVEMKVVQSKESDTEKKVTAKITIPNTNILDCYLDDHPGESITGIPDQINNTISYEFNIIAGTNPTKFRVVFECTPLSAGRTSVTVEYDDKVSSAWDYTGTIKYVEPTTEE